MFRGFAALIGLTLSLGAASAQSSGALDLGPGSYVYSVSHQDGGTTTETVTVLDDVPLTVGILWDDGSQDTAMLVTRSKENSQTFNDPDLIGNCASLLRDPEE